MDIIRYTFYPAINRHGLTVRKPRRKIMVPAMVMVEVIDDNTSGGGRQMKWYSRVPIHYKRRRNYP